MKRYVLFALLLFPLFAFATPAAALTDSSGLPKIYCLKTTDPTLATGEVFPLRCDSNGKLIVIVQPPDAGNAFVHKCYLSIKATATDCGSTAAKNLYGWAVGNVDNATPVYVQLFNRAAATVTLGTTPPVQTIALNPGGGNNGWHNFPDGEWSTAISAACTTTETGNTAPASNCTITLYYTN